MRKLFSQFLTALKAAHKTVSNMLNSKTKNYTSSTPNSSKNKSEDYNIFDSMDEKDRLDFISFIHQQSMRIKYLNALRQEILGRQVALTDAYEKLAHRADYTFSSLMEMSQKYAELLTEKISIDEYNKYLDERSLSNCSVAIKDLCEKAIKIEIALGKLREQENEVNLALDYLFHEAEYLHKARKRCDGELISVEDFVKYFQETKEQNKIFFDEKEIA